MHPNEETQIRPNGANSTTSDSSSSPTSTSPKSGVGKSQTAREKIDEFCEKLEIYMNQKGLPHPLPRHIDHYINIPRSELTLLAAEDLGEMAYEILSYAYYLQDQQNRQLAKADRCKSEIDRIVAPVLTNYRDIYGKEEKWLSAIFDNEQAISFHNVEINARAAATRVSYLTARLESIARCLLEMQQTKRRQNAKS